MLHNSTTREHLKVNGKRLDDIALRVHTSELWDITCHMGSHSVTCQPTQVNTPHLNPARKAGTVLYLPTPEGWKAELTWWLVTRQDSLPAHPSINRARRRVNMLIETNALPLSQATKPTTSGNIRSSDWPIRVQHSAQQDRRSHITHSTQSTEYGSEPSYLEDLSSTQTQVYLKTAVAKRLKKIQCSARTKNFENTVKRMQYRKYTANSPRMLSIYTQRYTINLEMQAGNDNIRSMNVFIADDYLSWSSTKGLKRTAIMHSDKCKI